MPKKSRHVEVSGDAHATTVTVAEWSRTRYTTVIRELADMNLALEVEVEELRLDAVELLKTLRARDPEDARIRYARLIRWLAKPYADNDPLLPEFDNFSKQPLLGNQELMRTWREVVRGQRSNTDPDEERTVARGDGPQKER